MTNSFNSETPTQPDGERERVIRSPIVAAAALRGVLCGLGRVVVVLLTFNWEYLSPKPADFIWTFFMGLVAGVVLLVEEWGKSRPAWRACALALVVSCVGAACAMLSWQYTHGFIESGASGAMSGLEDALQGARDAPHLFAARAFADAVPFAVLVAWRSMRWEMWRQFLALVPAFVFTIGLQMYVVAQTIGVWHGVDLWRSLAEVATHSLLMVVTWAAADRALGLSWEPPA